VKFGNIVKVFDTVLSMLDAGKEEAPQPPAAEPRPSPPRNLADQIESRLTNVVVAALKEAFDRDHARLELEREHLQEQRRRAEEAARMELLRQVADRELGRLKFLGGAALVGWVGSVLLLMMRLHEASAASRATLIGACVLLLVSLGLAFAAQATVSASVLEPDRPPKTDTGILPLSFLLAGLALAAVSLVL
jgi:hypothetical protein